jgi:hypothetical protein
MARCHRHGYGPGLRVWLRPGFRGCGVMREIWGPQGSQGVERGYRVEPMRADVRCMVAAGNRGCKRTEFVVYNDRGASRPTQWLRSHQRAAYFRG